MNEDNKSGMVHFVGAGPGAVDLITVRGARLLSEADVIMYAGSLINRKLLDYAKEDCVFFDSSGMYLEEIIKIMVDAVHKGKTVVRLHSGDPSVYGAIKEQMDGLDNYNADYDTTCGVSACFGAAASLNLEYTLPGVTQSLIITRMEGKTKTPDKEEIEAFASHGASMAIYLSANKARELQKSLLSGGYTKATPAAVVYKATWPEEKVIRCTLEMLAEVMEENNITKTAIILVGDAIGYPSYEKSKLYDRNFETEFRHAL